MAWVLLLGDRGGDSQSTSWPGNDLGLYQLSYFLPHVATDNFDADGDDDADDAEADDADAEELARQRPGIPIVIFLATCRHGK